MAVAKVSNVLPGYPTKWGQKIAQIVDWTGPTLYAAGGMTLLASDLAMGGIDIVLGGVSQSGTYRAEGRAIGTGTRASIKIMVFVIATGLEAGAIHLDAEIFRLCFIGV